MIHRDIDEELKKLERELLGEDLNDEPKPSSPHPTFAVQELRALRVELETEIQECKRKAVRANQASTTSMAQSDIGKAVEFTVVKKVNQKLVQHLEKTLQRVEKAIDCLRA